MLTQEKDRPHQFLLHKPKTSDFHTWILFTCNRIILFGDNDIGGKNGVISDDGYGLDWFSTVKAERYLCSKFLLKEWHSELAVERLEEMVADEDYKDEAHQLRDIIEALDEGYMDSHGLYDALSSIGVDTDEIPGRGYDPQAASRLCAVQQRFVELYAEGVKNGTIQT